MRSLPTSLLALATLAFIGASTPLLAQRAPSGIGGAVTTIQSSERLGGGSLNGWSAIGVLGLSSRSALELGYAQYRGGSTDSEARAYDLEVPSLLMRAPLIGETSDLALLAGGAATRFSLGASGGAPAETRIIPSIGLGLSVRLHLAGPLYVDLSGRDWVSYARTGELTTTPGSRRRLGHSPEFRVSLLTLFRRKEAALARLEDLPVSYASDFRPVDASSVARASDLATENRDHLHLGQGASHALRPVSGAEMAGTVTPHGSAPALGGPLLGWSESILGTIYFQSGSYTVGTAYRTLLADAARYLSENPAAEVVLVSFTDASGNARFNQLLAEQRGTAIQELLTRIYDIAPDRVTVQSKGIDFRAKSASSARRVELIARLPKAR